MLCTVKILYINSLFTLLFWMPSNFYLNRNYFSKCINFTYFIKLLKLFKKHSTSFKEVHVFFFIDLKVNFFFGGGPFFFGGLQGGGGDLGTSRVLAFRDGNIGGVFLYWLLCWMLVLL